MEQKDIVLDVRKLNTSFVSDGQTIRIVKDVSFQLKRGKTLAIVGESGCGKSVTVHSIVKLLPQNARFNADAVVYRRLDEKAGKITEFDLSKIDPKSREMRSLRGADLGMVFQDPMSSLNPIYKVGDQVAEALQEYNKGKRSGLKKMRSPSARRWQREPSSLRGEKLPISRTLSSSFCARRRISVFLRKSQPQCLRSISSGRRRDVSPRADSPSRKC